MAVSGVRRMNRLQLRRIIREVIIEENKLPQTSIPMDVRLLLTKTIDKIKPNSLTHNQRLQIVWRMLVGMNVNRRELYKLTQRLISVLNANSQKQKNK